MPLDQVDVDTMDSQGKEMSFFEHLEELRWHLIRSSVAVLLVAIVIFVLGHRFFDNVILGPMQDWFPTFKGLCQLSGLIGLGEAGCFEMPEVILKDFALEEKFVTHIRISIVMGFVVAFPYVFWEFWRFISPGLRTSEKKYTRGAVGVCSFLFLVGVSFGYFVIAPFAIKFLVEYNMSMQVESNYQLKKFVNSMVMYTLPTGVVFELPVVVYVLSRLGLLTPDFMRQYRRHAFVLIFLLAAVITPPDIMTQFFIGIPLYLLYEFSILISKRVVDRLDKEAEKD